MGRTEISKVMGRSGTGSVGGTEQLQRLSVIIGCFRYFWNRNVRRSVGDNKYSTSPVL